MKSFLFLFILFYKINCDNYIENRYLNCSFIQSEFYCETCNEKDNYCHCYWNQKNNKCETNNNKLNQKIWILNFNKNYNEQNEEKTKKFCGETPKIIDKNYDIIPIEINGKFGLENEIIYCKYKIKLSKKSNLEISKFIIGNIIEDDNKPDVLLKANSVSKTMEIINFNYKKYYENLSEDIYLTFYIKIKKQYDTQPYKLEIKIYDSEKIRIYFLLIIPLPILIIFLIVICVKNKNENKKKNIQILINIKQIYNKNLEKYGNHCSICTENINNGNEISLTKCKHIFHYNCFFSWVTNKNNSRYFKCPICDVSLLNNNNIIRNRNNSNNNNGNMRPVNIA